jgi:glycine dehydrogenase subunit 1
MRYIPQTKDEQAQMLASVGIPSADSLFDCIPPEARLQALPTLPLPMTEPELVRHMQTLAAMNRPAGQCPTFLGAGVYDHTVPAAVAHLADRQEFYTAYTPYQPEISQGTLTAIFEYQTMMCVLTGLDVSNASMYDGASAAAEAMLLASAHTRRDKIVVADAMHPDTRAVIATYARFHGIEIVAAPFGPDGRVRLPELQGVAAVFVQNPNFFGVIENLPAVAEAAHAARALAVLSCDPLSLALLKTPGEAGFDLAVGDAQPLGLRMSFGGPGCGFMVAREALMRKMPGRICGETRDADGKRAFVLTLQAREQHIRREKATSNICSNQALCALMSTIYLSLVGPEGLRECAAQSARKAAYLREKLLATGKFEPLFTGPYFREFALRCTAAPDALNRAAREGGFIGGLALSGDYPELADCLLLAVTERRTRAEIDAFAERMAAV